MVIYKLAVNNNRGKRKRRINGKEHGKCMQMFRHNAVLLSSYANGNKSIKQKEPKNLVIRLHVINFVSLWTPSYIKSMQLNPRDKKKFFNYFKKVFEF
jgi:hypothetical protein